VDARFGCGVEFCFHVFKIADFDGNARIIFLFFLLIFLLTRWRENRLTDFYAAAGRSDKKSEACQAFF
jgi:hypothetical protein